MLVGSQETAQHIHALRRHRPYYNVTTTSINILKFGADYATNKKINQAFTVDGINQTSTLTELQSLN